MEAAQRPSALIAGEKGMRPLGMKQRSSIFKVSKHRKVQEMENITLDVDGDTDRFACEYLHEKAQEGLTETGCAG